MAKVRLTKKEVLKMFKEVDFLEHFKGTGKTESEIKEKVDSFTMRLQGNEQGEAGEREIIDDLTKYLGDVFMDDIAAIDKRSVNSEFERARAIAARRKSQALLDVFEAAKADYQTENKEDVEKNALGSRLGSQATEGKADEVRNAQYIISQKEEERRLLSEELQNKIANEAALRAEAKKQDEIDFYISKYEEEYKATLGFFKRVGYPKDQSKRAEAIKAYVEAKIAEEVHTENADGTISTPDAIKNVTPHTLFNPEVPGDQERAFDKSIKELKRKIANLSKEITPLTAEMQAAEGERAEYEAAARKCQAYIDGYNQVIVECNENISVMRAGLDATAANISTTERLTLETRLELAERILETELEDANPLLQLAYEGYIAQIKEQARIVEKFSTDAEPGLEAIINNDLNANSPNYMELALEHYIAEGFGSGRYNNDLQSLRKHTQKYFGKYIPDLETKYKDITRRYNVAATSLDYLEREVLAVDYAGKTRTKDFDEDIEKALEANSKALDNRVVSNRNRLEVINPDYDRITRYTQNPTVKDYMALTMLRESLIREQKEAEKNNQPFKNAGMLAEVSRRVADSIEIAKRNGTVIDLSAATQIATETLIPGYDEVVEFAKVEELDLTLESDRQVLRTMQKTFEAQTVMSHVSVEDVMMYAQFVGADIYDANHMVDATKREAFVKANMTKMADYFTKGTPIFHESVKKYTKYLETPAGREALAKNPKAVAEIYAQFGQAGIEVTADGDQLYINTDGNKPTPVDASRLLDEEFMRSVGLVMQLPKENIEKYQAVAKNTPSISAVLDARDSLCYVKAKGKDLGILGQASIYVAHEADFDLAEAREKLREIYHSPKKLKEFKEAHPDVADPKAELRKEYQLEYCKLMEQYDEKQAEMAQMAGQEELAVPVEQRQNNDPRNKEHSDVYDEAHIEVDKKTQYRGGVARTKALVEKVVAIEDAKLEFINASEEGKELLDEGIALAVVDMLGKLEEIKITNPNYLDILNQAIVKAMEARTEREDEYKVEMDENKNLSLAVGERVFSVGKDGKVAIGERKYEYPAERTVSETEPVQG